MEDIVNSRSKAMVRQGWLFGDKMSRIGHPYEWVDGDKQSYIYAAKGVTAILQGCAMYYEEYPTPAEINTPEFKEMYSYLQTLLEKLLKTTAPFLVNDEKWKMHMKCTALVRAQDFACINTYCKDLPKSITHVDLGPGLGSHAFYSLKGLGSKYIGVEASPHFYEIQRNIYRFLSQTYGDYLDIIECENFSVTHDSISSMLKKRDSYGIVHLPSWYFCDLPDASADLVTATWMLNETNHAGVLWLMSNAIRSLKTGGYFYIRDSENLKPARHKINYDELLLEKGFERVTRLDVVNRVNFFGIPRVYKKVKDVACTFDGFAEEYLGKFAITSHGGEYNQNMDKAPRQI